MFAAVALLCCQTMAAKGVLTVEQLNAQADELLGQEVSLTGVCVHLCGKAGGKIFMIGDDERKRFRVQATDECQFDEECLNAELVVTGVLKEDQLDEAFLVNWEQSVAVEAEEHDHDHEHEHADEEHGSCGGHPGMPSDAERIAKLRDAIAKRTAEEGKAYVSFYYIDAQSYEMK